MLQKYYDQYLEAIPMKAETSEIAKYIYKYKRELTLFTVVLVFVFGAIFGVSQLLGDKSEETLAVADSYTTNCYRVFIDDKDMGLVQSLEVGEQAIKDAMVLLSDEIGYDPEVTPKIRYYEEYSETEDFTENEALVVAIKETMMDSIDVIKEYASVMKIGDEFVVALESDEDVAEVLHKAQSLYVSDDVSFAVNLITCEYNSLVETPVIVPIQEELDVNRSFTGTSGDADSEEEDAESADSMYNGETVAVQFSEAVIVTEAYVDPSEILTVGEALALITKENEEPKIYTVKSGDCPSTIAEDNGMTLSELYELNPDLESVKYLQVGDELTVMVPEPELSVTTQEETVYITAIARGTTYVENPDKYVGSNVTTYSGYDGELQVTALVSKVNGTEVSRTVIDEEVIKEPANRIVEKGTKALPAKGATGTFIAPLQSYVVSSSYGYRWGGFHSGVDMAAPYGTPIRATDGGVVTYAGWLGDYGNVIFIDHGDGVTSRYGHCSSINVTVGQQVSQYEQIGCVGSTGHSTGNHVHFEIRFDGVTVDPMDYLEY
jgi:murein DD-endopeptidase MepM/ murein hydrolase activator NlpD